MKLEHQFVGARPLKTGELLYGRDEILDELSQRLHAERIVLLHSPSGVGKTSLIRAGVVPYFKDRDFLVPIGDATAGTLIERMSECPLMDLLFGQLDMATEQVEGDNRPKLLIIDQCEEIFTQEGGDSKKFIESLAAVCRRRDVWVLMAVREDYLGTLLSVGQGLPGSLRERVRLDLLDAEQVNRLIEASILGSDPAAEKVRRDLKRLCEEAHETSGLKRGVSPMMVQILAVTYLDQPQRSRRALGLSERGRSIDDLLAQYIDRALSQLAATPAEPDSDSAVDHWVTRIWLEEALTRRPDERAYCRSEQVPPEISQDALDFLTSEGILTKLSDERLGFSHDHFVPAIRQSNRTYQRDPKFAFEYSVARWRSSIARKWNFSSMVQATAGLTRWSQLGTQARAFVVAGLSRSVAWVSALSLVLGLAIFVGLLLQRMQQQSSALEGKQTELGKAQASVDSAKKDLDTVEGKLRSKEDALKVVEESLTQISDLNLARMQAKLVSWAVPARSAIQMLAPSPSDSSVPSGRSVHFARLLALELLSTKVRLQRSPVGAADSATRNAPASVCGLGIADGDVRFYTDCRHVQSSVWRVDAPTGDFGGAGALRDVACSDKLRAAAYAMLHLRRSVPPMSAQLPADTASGVEVVPIETDILLAASRMSEARIFGRSAEFDCFTSLDPITMKLGAVVQASPGLVGLSTAEIGKGRAKATTAYLWRISKEGVRRCLAGFQPNAPHTCPDIEIFGQVHIGAGSWRVTEFDVDDRGGLTAKMALGQSRVRLWAGTPDNVPVLSSHDDWLKLIHVENNKRIVVTASHYCVAEACQKGGMQQLLDGKQAYPLALFPAESLGAWEHAVVLLRNGLVVPVGAPDDASRRAGKTRYLKKATAQTPRSQEFSFDRGPGDPEILFHRVGSGGVAYHRRAGSEVPVAWILNWDESARVWEVSAIDSALRSSLLPTPESHIGAIGGSDDLILVATFNPRTGSALSICRLPAQGAFSCPAINSVSLGTAAPVSMDLFPLHSGFVVAVGLESGVIDLVFLEKRPEGSFIPHRANTKNQVHSGNAVVSLVPTHGDEQLLLVSGGTERAVAVHTVTVDGNHVVEAEPWGYVADFASPVFLVERATSKSGGAAALVGSVYGEVALLNLKNEDLVEQLCLSLRQSGEDAEAGCPSGTR